jgi:hypothetical protein
MRVVRRRVQSRCRGSEVASESPDTPERSFLEEFAFSILSEGTIPMREWGGCPAPNPLPPRAILR